MRKYPYENFKNGEEIPSKLAVALIIKFLKQNNCFGEFIDAWKYAKKRPNARPKEAIENGVNFIYRNGSYLTNFFSSIGASFTWVMAETVLRQKTKWSRISDKWYKTIPSIFVKE